MFGHFLKLNPVLLLAHFPVEGHLDPIEFFPPAADSHGMLFIIIQELGGHSTALHVRPASPYNLVEVINISLQLGDRIGGLIIVAEA
jgi:hypothetical protein